MRGGRCSLQTSQFFLDPGSDGRVRNDTPHVLPYVLRPLRFPLPLQLQSPNQRLLLLSELPVSLPGATGRPFLLEEGSSREDEVSQALTSRSLRRLRTDSSEFQYSRPGSCEESWAVLKSSRPERLLENPPGLLYRRAPSLTLRAVLH